MNMIPISFRGPIHGGFDFVFRDAKQMMDLRLDMLYPNGEMWFPEQMHLDDEWDSSCFFSETFPD